MQETHEMAKIPLATQVDVATSDDGQSTALRFRSKDGTFLIGLKNKELSRLAALLLEQSQKVAIAKIATTQASQRRQKTALTLHPIQSSGVGIAKGRTGSQRTLSVEIGNLTLAFWVDTSVINGLCDDLRRVSELLDPQKPH
jgi:hypothetical protein